jgi:hypothetical protein
MKKTVILFASIFIFSMLLFTHCDRKIKRVDNAIHYDSIQVAETYYLFQDTINPGCNLQIRFVYPDSADSHLRTLQHIFVEKIVGESFRNLDPQKAIEAYSEQYIQDFKQFESPEKFRSLTEPDPYTNETEEKSEYEKEIGFFYYTLLSNKIVYNQNNFVSFIVENENYEGGAHGSKSIYGYVVDLNTEELLTEDAFAGNNYKKNLASVLAQKIAEANGLERVNQLENIGYTSIEDIVPNGNFTIDSKGITYYFNEYDIAAYFIGITKVFIPYEELKIYITNENPISSLVGL